MSVLVNANSIWRQFKFANIDWSANRNNLHWIIMQYFGENANQALFESAIDGLTYTNPDPAMVQNSLHYYLCDKAI